jgi:isopentenyl-diphosphate Delta-isomerase
MENIKEKLKNTNIYIILSPPRAGSTLLGKCLSNSNDIFSYCHEPCFNYIYNKKDSNVIYDKILEKSNLKSTIIKEMTHWSNDVYQDLINLSNHPILFLIRNPIICTESKIRKFLMTCDMRVKKSLNCFLKSFLKSDKDHNTLLNDFALQKGFKSWKEMIIISFHSRNYKPFEEILRKDDIFSVFDLGFEPLLKQINYCKSKFIPFLIVDNIDYRLNPKIVSKKICNKWNIKYNDKIVEWGKHMNISTDQENEFQKIWYETLNQSTRVLPPSEIEISTNRFPKKIQNYLENIAIPIYILISNMQEKINIPKKNNKIIVPLNKIAIETLIRLGINPNVDNLKKLNIFVDKSTIKELIFEDDEAQLHGVKMKIKDIDTLYDIHEKIDVLDSTGEKIGVENRDIIHKKGLWHRSVHVLIFNKKKEIILQKRNSTREINPNFWTVSASGHVKSGQNPIDAAISETFEELGVYLKKNQLKYLCEYKKEKKYKNLIDREFNPIFIAYVDVEDFKPNNEVDEIMSISLKKLKEKIKNNEINFKPDREEYHKILFSIKP